MRSTHLLPFSLFLSILMLGVAADLADVLRDYKEIILARNFSVETHTVLTEDGYILSLVRIPANKLGEKLQAELEEKAKPEIEKRAELKKKTASAAKERRERKTTKK